MPESKVVQRGPLTRIGEASVLLFGDRSRAARARVARMVDRGELRAVRLGARGDRWIVVDDIERLLQTATPNGRSPPTVARRTTPDSDEGAG